MKMHNYLNHYHSCKFGGSEPICNKFTFCKRLLTQFVFVILYLLENHKRPFSNLE